jgi:hypothetical protein
MFQVLFSNGVLEICNNVDGSRLGRTEPWLPVNVDPTASLANIKREFEELAAERNRRQGLPLAD